MNNLVKHTIWNWSPLEQKILLNILIGVICTDMVNFCMQDHMFVADLGKPSILYFQKYWFKILNVSYVDTLPLYIHMP